MRIDSAICDAGRRASDTINELLAHNGRQNLAHKWIAIRLEDGSYDGTLYDTRQDCVKHQKDEFMCAYFSFRLMGNGVQPMEIARVLAYHRDAYKAGFRLPDPEDRNGGLELLMPTATYDLYRADMIDVAALIRADREINGY